MRQMRFKYNLVGASAYSASTAMCYDAATYSAINEAVNVHYSDVGSAEDAMLKQIIARNKLPLNTFTYIQAYKYAKLHKLIKANKAR